MKTNKSLKQFIKRLNFAQIVSAVFNPFALSILFQVLLYLHTYTSQGKPHLVLTFVIIQGSAPLLLIFLFMRLRLISDLDITDRKERTLYFSILVFLIFLLVYVIKPFLPDAELLIVPISLGVTLFFMVIINLWWKISGHMSFDTILFLSLGSIIHPGYYFFLGVLPLIAWSRVKQKKHTWLQTLGGTILGAIVFWVVSSQIPVLYNLNYPSIFSLKEEIHKNSTDDTPIEPVDTIKSSDFIDTKINEIEKPEESNESNNNLDVQDVAEQQDTEESKTKNWWEYPDQIFETPKNGDDLLVLANKKYKLPSSYTPTDLTNLGSTGLRYADQKNGRKIIVEPLKELAQAAKADGIDLAIKSAYRSYSTQQATYNYWVNKEGGFSADGTSPADKYSARAGHSEHQLGTTIDFTTKESGDNIGSVFHDTAAAKWLEENAWRYGFIISYPEGSEEVTGYVYESWHYRYIGANNATEWHESGMVLSEWLEER